MSAPLANRTTISSRNKIAQLNHNNNHDNGQQDQVLTTQTTTTSESSCKIIKSNMPPPSQIARNRALKTPAPASHQATTSRLASLAKGLPSSFKEGKPIGINRRSPTSESATNSTQQIGTSVAANNIANGKSIHATTSLKPPKTRPLTSKTIARPTSKANNAIPPNTSSRISAPHSRINGIAPLSSRSSSILSSVSSATISKQRPPTDIGGKQLNNIVSNHNNNNIPDTNVVRKGLAKFSNPIECQRQFQALSLKVRQKDEIIEAREMEIDKLQGQLKHAVNVGIGYATAVQYFAVKLKLDSETDLLTECEKLKSRVSDLEVSEREHEGRLEAVVNDYKEHLKIEHDLRNNLERELEEAHKTHSELIEGLKNAHKDESDDLNEKHSTVKKELLDRVATLESDLTTRSKELADLKKEHEVLNNSFNKLEESLTKDKDARVKYAQEKIGQLQKDVDSLNSVLEMRLEKIHALEKDSILLAEVQNELINQKDANKALTQQLESLNAALEKRREQFENLIVEHEKTRQELKRERKERRRMTMKTEQLEYVLNESCASESNMVFNSTIRDLDGADHLV